MDDDITPLYKWKITVVRRAMAIFLFFIIVPFAFILLAWTDDGYAANYQLTKDAFYESWNGVDLNDDT